MATLRMEMAIMRTAIIKGSKDAAMSWQFRHFLPSSNHVFKKGMSLNLSRFAINITIY